MIGSPAGILIAVTLEEIMIVGAETVTGSMTVTMAESVRGREIVLTAMTRGVTGDPDLGQENAQGTTIVTGLCNMSYILILI